VVSATQKKSDMVPRPYVLVNDDNSDSFVEPRLGLESIPGFNYFDYRAVTGHSDDAGCRCNAKKQSVEM
jgi:hypothetical protein